MRSRTVREGSVGLLILVGLALFGGLVLWLRGFSPGKSSYKVVAEFANAAGIQVGATVRYRGVNVGKVTALNPGANGVAMTLEIAETDLLMPRDVLVEANQSGLIGETSIDIRPLKPVPANVKLANPTSPNCNSNVIICNNSRLSGQVGVSLDELLRSTTRLANVYTNPEFVTNLNAATKNTAIAAAEVAKLSRDFSTVSVSIKQNLNTFSSSASEATRTANQTAYQYGLVANQLSNTANKFGNTADRYGQTAIQLNQLAASVNGLVVENRATLASTLKNFSQASAQLRDTASTLTPTLQKVSSTFNQVNAEKLVSNLEAVTTNAAQASANLRDISASLKDPKNALLLQQTLDSARATFENTQKITSDLDDLTGDPAFRDNLRNLVNGLGKLVSSTQQLQEQVQIAQVLEPVRLATQNAARLTPLTNTSLPEPVQLSQDLVVPANLSITLTGESLGEPNRLRSEGEPGGSPDLPQPARPHSGRVGEGEN